MNPKVIEALEEATGSDARWDEKLAKIAEAGRYRDTPDYQAERDEAVALLRELEWAGGDGICWCPECEHRPKEGHKPDCRLGAFLEKVGR